MKGSTKMVKTFSLVNSFYLKKSDLINTLLTLWKGEKSKWILYYLSLSGTVVAAQDVTEEEEAADEDTTDDVNAEDEDDEAEVEDDENTGMVSA